MGFFMRGHVLFLSLAALLALSAPASAQGPEYRAPVEKPKAQPAPPQGEQPPQPKFPNKDTAKNRQDYEMGTDTGTIVIGRDAQTGEDVVLHVPPKKNQPQEPDPPIEVKPVVPLIWKR